MYACIPVFAFVFVRACGSQRFVDINCVFLYHFPFYFLRHGLSIEIWSLLLQLRLTGQHAPGTCLCLPLLSFPALGSQMLSATPSFYVAVTTCYCVHVELSFWELILLLPCGPNSDCHTWQRAPLPAISLTLYFLSI